MTSFQFFLELKLKHGMNVAKKKSALKRVVKKTFIKRKGNLRAGTSNNVPLSVARSLSLSADQVTYLHRSVLLVPLAYVANPTVLTHAFRLTDLPVGDITSISTSWDHYRIEEVAVTLYRIDNQFSPTQLRYDNTTGQLTPTVVPADQHVMTVISYDSVLPAASLTWDNMMQWGSARHAVMGSGRSDTHVRRFKPLPAIMARQFPGSTAPAVLGIKDSWIDLGYPDIDHYGYNLIIRDDIHPTAATALAVYQIKIEYLIAVKGTR